MATKQGNRSRSDVSSKAGLLDDFSQLVLEVWHDSISAALALLDSKRTPNLVLFESIPKSRSSWHRKVF